MPRRALLPAVAIAGLVLWIHAGSPTLRAQTTPASALTGVISSVEEGPMEGVLVTIRRAGANFAVTVGSDARGRYSFPRNRVEPGQYDVKIRAIGYDLDGPGAATVTAQQTAALDLKLRKTRDLSAQLTSAEWLNSIPGTPEQKRPLVQCGFCHPFERVVKTRYNAEQWVAVIQRMGTYYSDGTSLRHHQRSDGRPPAVARTDPPRPATEGQKQTATYLASINRSAGPVWSYELKTFPRLRGESTHMLVTEYDFPRADLVEHDLTVDSHGLVWYVDSGGNAIGNLDPKTAKFSEYPLPSFAPANPQGLFDVNVDRQDVPWAAMGMSGSKVMRFDPKTLEPEFFDVPPPENGNYRRITFIAANHSDVDGKIWATDSQSSIIRVDPKTGKVDLYDAFANAPGGRQGHRIYQVMADSQNNGFFTDTWGAIGRVDAKTGEVKLWPTPTPDSFARRGQMDDQGRLWFGEFRVDRIGMFDSKTEKFQEWPVSIPYTSPYFAHMTKTGDVWVTNNQTDRMLRLNPGTGVITEYQMPGYTDTRKIYVDPSTDNVTMWLPNKNKPTIMRIEPLS